MKIDVRPDHLGQGDLFQWLGGRLYAADIQSGRQNWQVQTGGDIYSTGHSPAVFDGVVYFGSPDGNLYALDSQTGAEKWRFQTDAPVGSSPAVSDGVVFFGGEDGYLYAVAPAAE